MFINRSLCCLPLSLCRIWIAFLFVGSEKAFDVVVSHGQCRRGAADFTAVWRGKPAMRGAAVGPGSLQCGAGICTYI
jgi:hypothetical protein